MTSCLTPVAHTNTFLTRPERLKFLDRISDLYNIATHFPSDSLDSVDRHELGIHVLEKFGEAHFPYYQRTYRLTQAEHELIFLLAGNYTKGFTRWETLDESLCKEDVSTVRSRFKDAQFYLLTNLEENERTMPIVAMEGKRYYFYSRAYKGPIVNEDYIAQYKACQEQECRPDFQVLQGESRTVFLMEFVGETAPNFRDELHLKLLIELIVRRSCNKKLLDMLPCRLALKDQKLYCVDQKLTYVDYPTEFEAFRENISTLKSKVAYRGYAEEGQLFSYIDKVAQSHLIAIFEKSIAPIQYGYEIQNKIRPDSLNSEEKIYLAAAVLKTLGTRELLFVARDYKLSVEDQKTARTLAGDGLIENTATWDDAIPPNFEELHQKTQRILQEHQLEGKFFHYTNYVGNWKGVLTVVIEDKIYVVREMDQKYIEKYKSRKEREQRPDFLSFPLEGDHLLFLTKFMGSQTLDYSNTEHLDMIFELALSFTGDEKDIIDFNTGNLVVDGNRLFYIDKDLTYAPTENPIHTNIEAIFTNINSNLHCATDRARSRIYIEKKFQEFLAD